MFFFLLLQKFITGRRLPHRSLKPWGTVANNRDREAYFGLVGLARATRKLDWRQLQRRHLSSGVRRQNVSEKLWNLELLKSMERRLLFLILYHHSVSFLHKNVHLKHNYSMIWRSFQVAKFITFCKDNHGHLRCHWTVILFKRTTFTVNYDVSPGLKPFTVFVFLTLLFFSFFFSCSILTTLIMSWDHFPFIWRWHTPKLLKSWVSFFDDFE